MTGYGRAKIENDTREYIVEVKSVNHKYLDINIKLPKTLFCIEDKIRKVISNKISRGKIDVFVTYINYGIEGKTILINKDIAKMYIKEIEEIATENNIASGIRATEISKFPEVLNVIVDEEDEEKIWLELNKCLEKALDNFIEMRITEGEKIKEDLKQRLDEIDENINEIFKNSTGLVEEYVVKLRKRIQEILNTDVVDETRLAQEIVIYSDKTSIEEEITRIKSHIIQFKELLNSEGAIGKKADFIIQEMNREINTIGSKSGKFEITQLVIKIKTQIEDIREQIQNIE
jgi:TIGR00255 family protein